MRAYVDRAEKEFSIHQLEELDMELILEAIVHYGNEITNSGTDVTKKTCKPRLVHLKNSIENELLNH